MHGLQTLDLKQPSLSDLVLKRKRKENATIEINNYVAGTPLAEVTRAAVKRILKAYGCDYSTTKPALTVIYAQVLNHFLEDRRVSEEEQEQLTHLRDVLGLTEDDVRAIDREVLLPVYRKAVSEFFSDGHFTFAEGQELERMSRELGMDAAETDAMTLNEAYRVFEESTKRAAPDGGPPDEGQAA